MVETLQSHCVKNGRNRVDHIGGTDKKLLAKRWAKREAAM